MAALNLLNHGFGHCSEEAFASFATDLTQGAWASVARVRDDSADRRPAGSLLREPFAVVWRAQLTWSVEDMAAALNAQSNNDVLDIAWDRSQRRLDGQVTADENHDDPARSAAAARIRKGFLVGRGTEQTTWTLDREVDLGRAQVKRAVSDEYKSDVALLGYGPIFAEVHKTTEALARSIGRGDEATKGTPRHARRRAAFGNCVTAFNLVFGQMGLDARSPPAGRRPRPRRVAPRDAARAARSPRAQGECRGDLHERTRREARCARHARRSDGSRRERSGEERPLDRANGPRPQQALAQPLTA